MCMFFCFVGTPSPTVSHCKDVLDDCDTANMTFRICNNFDVARKSCAEFCGLCGIGTFKQTKTQTNKQTNKHVHVFSIVIIVHQVRR